MNKTSKLHIFAVFRIVEKISNRHLKDAVCYLGSRKSVNSIQSDCVFAVVLWRFGECPF